MRPNVKMTKKTLFLSQAIGPSANMGPRGAGHCRVPAGRSVYTPRAPGPGSGLYIYIYTLGIWGAKASPPRFDPRWPSIFDFWLILVHSGRFRTRIPIRDGLIHMDGSDLNVRFLNFWLRTFWNVVRHFSVCICLQTLV